MQKHYVKLSSSEQALLNASSQILAGFIAGGQFSDAKAKELEDKSIALALGLADKIEKSVVADEEVP